MNRVWAWFNGERFEFLVAKESTKSHWLTIYLRLKSKKNIFSNFLRKIAAKKFSISRDPSEGYLKRRHQFLSIGVYSFRNFVCEFESHTGALFRSLGRSLSMFVTNASIFSNSSVCQSIALRPTVPSYSIVWLVTCQNTRTFKRTPYWIHLTLRCIAYSHMRAAYYTKKTLRIYFQCTRTRTQLSVAAC